MAHATTPIDTTTLPPPATSSEPIAALTGSRQCNQPWGNFPFTPEQRAAAALRFVEQRHAVASVGAALVGVGILATRKGTKPHRILGRVWTGVAVLTSLNAFRMRDAHGDLTWFHGLSVLTLSSAIAGVYCARTKQIARHKRLMGVAYASAVLAGVVARATPSKTIAFQGPTELPFPTTQA